MYREDRHYGLGLINSCLPTAKAVRYLNWFQTAGWHRCNAGYHPVYPEGDAGTLALFTVSGEGFLQMGGAEYTLTAGTAALVAPLTPMAYGTGRGGEWEFYWINMGGPAVGPAARHMAEDGAAVFRPACFSACVRAARELIALERGHVLSFEMEVSRRIARLVEDLVEDRFFAADRQEEPLADRVAAYLEQHLAQPLRLEELSRVFYLSKNQLSRVFHAQTGYTPYEYLKRYRLLKACELLQVTALPVEEVGRRVGFGNGSNFIYQFRSLYGMTPRTYRQRFGQTGQEGKASRHPFKAGTRAGDVEEDTLPLV